MNPSLFDHLRVIRATKGQCYNILSCTELEFSVTKVSISSLIFGTCKKSVLLQFLSGTLTYKNNLSFDQTGLSGSSSTSCTSNIFPAVFMNVRSALLLLLKQK